MISKLFLVFLIFHLNNLRANAAYQLVSSEYNPKNGNWGLWGSAVFCPKDEYVTGFRTKLESEQWNGDDTALNGVEVRCSNETVIKSDEGPWGKWGEWSNCSDDSAVFGFQIKIEEKMEGDDTATNGVRFLCDDNKSIKSSEGPWGSWSRYFLCKSGYFMCGIQTQIEPNQKQGDDTAMNNMRIYCCNYDDPK